MGGSLSGKTVKGVSSFATYMAKDFSNLPNAAIPTPACARQITCKDAAVTLAGQACVAGNAFMKLKDDIRTPTIFKCRLFMGPNGQRCDVKNMVKLPSGQYSNDCMWADGSVKLFEYDCNLDEFTSLVQDFETRVDKVFARLDASAKVTLDKININMKQSVDREVTDRITRFANGVTCGFLGISYRLFVRSACYAGVTGFADVSWSYVACGLLLLALVIVFYVVWRITVDNYNANSKEAAEGSVRHKKAGAAQTAQGDAQAQAPNQAGVASPADINVDVDVVPGPTQKSEENWNTPVEQHGSVPTLAETPRSVTSVTV